MRLLALPASLLLSITLQTFPARVSADIPNDFSSYPQGSQQCLNDAADQSQCSGNTGQQLNECLCKNQGNFIYNTASCVAKNSPADLNAVYDTMSNNCAGTGVTIAVSKDAFLSQAAAATSTTSSGTPTSTGTSTSASTSAPTDSPTSSTSPSTPTTTAAAASSGISTTAKIGLGVGIGFGSIALGLLAWFVWAYSRRRRSQSPSSSSNPANSPDNHDVELSPSTMHNHNNNNGSYISTLTPATEYAQHTPQFGVAELAPASNTEWKELPAAHSSYSSFEGDGAKSDKRGSGVPLLRAELGSDEARTTPSPSPTHGHVAELPGNVAYGDSTPTLTSMHPQSPYSPYNDQTYGHGYGHGYGQGQGG
ncbi:hypothetical protein F5Y13DRAFT_13208 [Hypoxylon sp. FL1857]|nr:hypothetical protein F5Y13DRAFT_13208 [Hypoxylon sp. FL1857]